METYLICLAAALIGGLMLSRVTKLLNLPAVTAYLVSGLLLSAILAAAMSTADSQLLASASAFASDVYKPIIRKNKASVVAAIVIIMIVLFAFLMPVCNTNYDSRFMDAFYAKKAPRHTALRNFGIMDGGMDRDFSEKGLIKAVAIGMAAEDADAFIAHAGIFNEEHMYMTTEEMWFPNFDNGGLHETEIDPKVGTADAPVGPAGDGVTFGGIKQGGSPWSNDPRTVRHYRLSPHNLVTRWHTPLMVIHGGMDYRVPVDQGMAAYNAAQMMGVPSRLLIFPDENHWILKPQNALMWHREYFRWLEQWCR